MESEDIRYEIKDMRYNWRYADFLEILVGFRQQSDKLLFAGMAGCKCVTMACDYRNTIGGVLGIVTLYKPLLDALARERPRLPCVKGAVKNL